MASCIRSGGMVLWRHWAFVSEAAASLVEVVFTSALSSLWTFACEECSIFPFLFGYVWFTLWIWTFLWEAWSLCWGIVSFAVLLQVLWGPGRFRSFCKVDVCTPFDLCRPVSSSLFYTAGNIFSGLWYCSNVSQGLHNDNFLLGEVVDQLCNQWLILLVLDLCLALWYQLVWYALMI